ncbi:MAG: hypothetical protein QW420_06445 [Candidatus Caldarchaeum sp.]
MLVKNILRVITIAFFSMSWVFIIMPLTESAGVRWGYIEKVISFIAVPFTGLVVAQLILWRLGKE